MINVYYSRSNEVNDKEFEPHIVAFIKTLSGVTGERVTITKHDRNSSKYKPQKVLDADLVIVGTCDVDTTTPHIAKGCATEIYEANKAGIPVFAISNESLDVNYNPRGLYTQLITNDDIVILDETNWKLGHAFISLYCAAGGCAPSAFLNDDKAFFNMLIETGVIKPMLEDDDISTLKTFVDASEVGLPIAKSRIEELVCKEKPRKNILLVRRRMRR